MFDAIFGPLVVAGICAVVAMLWRISSQLQGVTYSIAEHDRRIKALEASPCNHRRAFITPANLALAVALWALIACVVLIIGACAVGRTSMGEDVIGVTTGGVNRTSETVMGLPPFQAIASLAALFGVGAAAHYRGTRVGWDEAVDESPRTAPRSNTEKRSNTEARLVAPSATLDIPKD